MTITEIRSSQTTPLPIHTMYVAQHHTQTGKIGVAPCPDHNATTVDPITQRTIRWRRNLALDLQHVQAWHPHHVVCVLNPLECAVLARLPQSIEELGMHWHHVPVALSTKKDSRFATSWADLGPQLAMCVRHHQHNILIVSRTGEDRAKHVAEALWALVAPGASLRPRL